MPRYQLQVAIALDAIAVLSGLLLYITRAREGKIQLPAHTGDRVVSEVEIEDPFDVTTPQDILDGYPLEEESFWKRMRARKIVICTIACLLVLVEATNGIFAGDNAVLLSVLHLSFAVYIFGLSLASLSRQDVPTHSKSIWHISFLAAFAFALLGFTALVPTQDLPVAAAPNVAHIGISFRAYQKYAALALHLLLFVVASTTPCGPALHYPPSAIYSEKVAQEITNKDENNVSGVYGASPFSTIFFSYSTKVIMLGATAARLEIGDLPILTADMRATFHYDGMKRALRDIKLSLARPGSGLTLAYQLARANAAGLLLLTPLSFCAGFLFYAPHFFMSRVLKYLEDDPLRENRAWGFVWAVALLGANFVLFITMGQVWSLSSATLQARIRTQLNTVLFAKTLLRKDIASASASGSSEGPDKPKAAGAPAPADSEFSSKSQIMTLMTTDVDRVGRFSQHYFVLIDVPIEILVGTTLLYQLLGISSLLGLAVAILCLPLNHFAGKIVARAQDRLMKTRDERVGLMNEVLGGIRMLKFMAWERSFEKRILKIRAKELGAQRLNYIIESLLSGFWDGIPVVMTIAAFWHFAVVRGQALTPSIAFTSIIVFGELRFALGGLTELFISILQSVVSLRRIEKYLHTREVSPVPALGKQSRDIAFQSCTVTWPQDRFASRSTSASAAPSAVSTPRYRFLLMDLTLRFPRGELSLVCGRLGSGKTLLLLALLGEADVLSGSVLCPRTPANSLASLASVDPATEEWVIEGVCAYVPQTSWLQNASIKDNILFHLPYDERRYRLTLEACALVPDLKILEDGDESEIGERGVNLSGGQKARVSLARAVYSRASILLLDDVLSAVDAHTANHLYNSCLRGELMRGRTVILVSHHVQLCVPGAAYVVTLENGRVLFQGSSSEFQNSDVISGLVQSTAAAAEVHDAKEEAVVDTLELPDDTLKDSDASTVAHGDESTPGSKNKKTPRKFIEEEQRAVGRVGWSVWKAYADACGSAWYWTLFCFAFTVAALVRVSEMGWLSYWSRSDGSRSPMFYLAVYAAVAGTSLSLVVIRFLILYLGGIHASGVLYKKLLDATLFAEIRFHDTVSRGRVLNRFGKDFEGIDSNLPGNIGRTALHLVSTITTIITISVTGGPAFLAAAIVLLAIYYQIAKVYGQACRDMRRLDSVTRSPLYSMYSETISGVTVLRAFGASSKFLRDMLRNVDTNCNPAYWTWGINRWLSVRILSIGSIAVAFVAFLIVLNKNISASLGGFMLAFSSSILFDLLLAVREFVSLEQSMVALERVKEYSELTREPPEVIEPRPDSSWPRNGAIQCENLVVRYAPDLPNVLHNLTFNVKPGEKIGILGRTGSGKSTLALSFFRFVEPKEGRIIVDGIDITQIGLTDLRGRLTIIPQDPTILSGTLRSTLDVFGEYQDAEIFEALRRVHLIPSEVSAETDAIDSTVNANTFRDLDSAVSEGGENFSTGEKQLLCMARAILKRSKVLVMDEATASVDYATDELIGKTIRHEFKDSTILTIAHRLRTVIDYDKIILLEQGRIAEFDKPSVLLSNPSSQFTALCKATGKKEFAMLKEMAGV